MASGHGTTLNPGSGGDTLWDYDLGTAGAYPSTGKVQGTVLLVGPDNTTAPTVVTTVHPLPVTGTVAVTAASLPLPSGAATSANQATANTALGTLVTNSPVLIGGGVPVVLSSGQLSTLAPLSSVSVSNLPATQPISATSLPLPSGAATSSAQASAGTSLTSIDGKTPALGQALASASVPVVLTAAQVTSLTPPTTVTANAGTGTMAVSLASLPVLPAGTNVIGHVVVDSGTVTANLGTLNGASTSAAQTTGNTSLASIDTKTPSLGQALAAASVPVVLTAAQVTALTPPTTVTANAGTGTMAVSVAATTSGGALPFRLVSSATTNATAVKTSAGQVFGVAAFNTNASPRYLKFYDKSSAPVVGSDAPVLVYLIPGGTTGAGVVVPVPGGVQFSFGIALAVTGGMADADATSVGASEVAVSLTYK